ncbi:caspase-3-like isoform X2 [Acropora muricata]
MEGIKFGDSQSAVAFRGIDEAFPDATIYDGSIGQDLPGPDQSHALVSVLEISLKDNNLVAVTRSGEKITINNCSRNNYQDSSIQVVELSIRKPRSEEDVGDLILVSFGSKPTDQGCYWATCEGILLSEVSTEHDCYKMESYPRGHCLIINNMCFENEKLNRPCAIHDEEKLQSLFGNDLQFQVHVENDLQNFEMQQICTEYSEKDHSKCDAFVCILMSHGDVGDKIVGVKGRTIGIEQLMSEFKTERCPSLAGKPKIFFVQACRGSLEDKFLRQGDESRDFAGLTCDSTLASSISPQESDFLLAFATVRGYVALKRRDYGSFYIQALTEVIARNHNKDHLSDILTAVNCRVSDALNQVSPTHSTLRYKVFL